MPTYYDLVLGMIPVAFVGSVAAGLVLGVATSTAITAASLLIAVVVAHALFINPPGDRRAVSAGHPPSSGSRTPATRRTDQATEFAE